MKGYFWDSEEAPASVRKMAPLLFFRREADPIFVFSQNIQPQSNINLISVFRGKASLSVLEVAEHSGVWREIHNSPCFFLGVAQQFGPFRRFLNRKAISFLSLFLAEK